MSTFLELAQLVASESGTFSGTVPSAVTGQTGRLAKVVRWTNEAWRSIQNAHGQWRWMQSQFTGSITDGTQSYAPTSFTDVLAAAAISRFGEWVCTGDETEDRFSIYKTATGVSDETVLKYLDWNTFYTERMRGSVSTEEDRPGWFTINPANNYLYFSKIPDTTYTVRGFYRKSPQELSADGDTPEMPSRFHDLIVDIALEHLGTHDEAQGQIPLWRLRRFARFNELERDQLPKIRLAGPLA